MSIREDGKLNWKTGALSASSSIKIMLTPILEAVLKDGMTYEDFYYLVGDAAQMLILEHDRKCRYKMPE